MKSSAVNEVVISLNLVIAIFIFLVLGCVGANKDKTAGNTNLNGSAENTNAANTSPKNSNGKKTIEEADEFKKLNPAEHLAEAKKLYNNKPSEYELYLTALHLKAIPDVAPEYAEAQTILKQIQKTSNTIDEEKLVDTTALQVVSSSWRRGAFGAAGIWNVTFYNKSDKPIGDIEYQTRYYSETGNDLGGTGGLFTSGEVQKVIPPKQKRTVKINDGFINKEAASANFKVTGWRFIE